MQSYPKIYSLSTAGVRQHFCTDYLIHPLRTDFTGDNGLGKSIISDLMQLIFVPQREIWKPGTEGIDKHERKIEGIPLNRDFVQYAYAFMNIEKVRDKFIAIGVYIPKTSRFPVRPFIIQASDDFENKQLTPFDRPLKATDFIGTDKTILDLKDLKEHLRINFNLHLKDFHHQHGISGYYEFLYKNYLLPIDLTRQGNLKAFAKILQSYSRAKTLDITNSKSLQNFLFEDNDEIRVLFDDQRDKLESYIRQYRDNLKQVRTLELKQAKLIALKSIFDQRSTVREEFLKADAFCALKKLTGARLHDESNIKRMEGNLSSYDRNKMEWERITRKTLGEWTQLQRLCRLSSEHFNKLRHEFSDEKIMAKKEEANRLRDLLRSAEEVYPVFEKYGDAGKMTEKLDEQELMKEKKAKLAQLRSLSCFNDFTRSRWAEDDYPAAEKYYRQRISELEETGERLSTLLDLFEGDKPDSFFDWAIRKNQPLTRGQETLLMHLKEVGIKKPAEISEGARFTTDPSELIKSFEEDPKGIWIILGHIREFVPFVAKQRFNNPDNLQAVIEKDINEIRTIISEAEGELNTIRKMNSELVRIGFNEGYLVIYLNSDEIDAYMTDERLTREKIEKTSRLKDELSGIESLRIKFNALDQETIKFAKQQIEIENAIRQIDIVSGNCEFNIEKLVKETGFSVPENQDENTRFPEIHTGSIIEVIREYEGRISRLQSQKSNLEQILSSAQGTIEGCRNMEPLLKKEVSDAQKRFDEKKTLLESETTIRFDDLVLSIDYSDDDVMSLLEKSTRLEKEYNTEFTRVTETFDETRGNRNPDLQTDAFNFYTLVNVLCGRMGLDGLGPELERLNEELKKFGEMQLTLILDLFRKVETHYYSYKKLITELNFFFKDNRISGLYHFQIDFNERQDIAIDWIGKMRDKSKDQRLGAGLFTPTEYLPGEENSPEKLIINLARSFSSISNCEITDLLNPKFYFELRVGLYDDTQKRFSGSGGEAYTALALLCIGRLSVIQRDSFRQGVRFIIIEELSNIDDTNFNLFPEIARQFGYQLLTMTPKPFGSYSDSEWFLHMLIRGKEKDINYKPMSFFRHKNFRQKLDEYAAAEKKNDVA
ncbi:MAG: hypothetical protein HYY40_05275 [Bacteroidetes bacterium]|nr:hypothetical protein [Bacteroidota bacterium]